MSEKPLPDDRGGTKPDATIEDLVRTLRRASESDRCEAARSLGTLDPLVARSAVPQLIRSLGSDGSYEVRNECADALERIVARDPSAIDARLLLRPLKHHHARFRAIGLFNILDSKARRPLVPALRRIVHAPWSGFVRPFLTAIFDYPDGTWLCGYWVDDREFQMRVRESLEELDEPYELPISWFRSCVDGIVFLFSVSAIFLMLLVALIFVRSFLAWQWVTRRLSAGKSVRR
jgi:hypothetical protein